MRSDTHQELARGLKFQIYEVVGLYYLCHVIKGPDQLADVCLCYCIIQKAGFLMTWLK